MKRRRRNGTNRRSIVLDSGGTLTLTLPGLPELFALNSQDRAFVFGLIDTLNEYEQRQGQNAPPQQSEG
jgi:hypothetical protein